MDIDNGWIMDVIYMYFLFFGKYVKCLEGGGGIGILMLVEFFEYVFKIWNGN